MLGAEKRPVYTAGNQHPTATTSEVVEYTIPSGWELSETELGDLIVAAPWGFTYLPNDLLEGKENPYFAGYNKDGDGFRVKLDYKLL